jgi:hypothetical protein
VAAGKLTIFAQRQPVADIDTTSFHISTAE